MIHTGDTNRWQNAVSKEFIVLAPICLPTKHRLSVTSTDKESGEYDLESSYYSRKDLTKVKTDHQVALPARRYHPFHTGIIYWIPS
jgi:hypothetical protein